MLKKTIEREKRKHRPKQWRGFYTRKTPTKREKLEKIKRKERDLHDDCHMCPCCSLACYGAEK